MSYIPSTSTSPFEAFEADFAEATRPLELSLSLPLAPETAPLAIAQFHHDTSRALDPQLHTHNVLLNRNATDRQLILAEWRGN